MHISPLISDLALILISASITTLIFKWLKQPIVVGYIVAGCLISSQVSVTPTVGSTEAINTWSDIGVIFLLFALGLEFSFKKLFNVGKTALIATLFIVFFMVILGFLVGLSLGWGVTNSILLGGMISMSSTTIIIKALDDLGLRSQKFTNVVFGILILEDLMAILILVVISTTAVSKEFEGGELILNIGKLLFFITVWLTFGIFFIPTLLKKAKRFLNEETTLIVSLSLCLGMVLFAIQVGFSSALGAFVMGSILAETIESENIERIVKPVKNLFGAIFFVSVGMMVNFEVLQEYAFPIIIITLTVIVGQIVFATFGILLSGQSLKMAIQSSFSLTQIGEFAFIIAALGSSLKLIDPFLYPVIVAVSVITIFITPFMIKLSGPANEYVEKKIPLEWKDFIERHAFSHKSALSNSVWHQLIVQIVRIVAVYSALVIAIELLSVNYFIPFVTSQIHGWPGQLLASGVTILAIAPFLRAIVAKKNHSKEYHYLWGSNRYNRPGLVLLILVRFFMSMAFTSFILIKTFDLGIGFLLIISAVLSALMMVSKKLKLSSIIIERKFLFNLNSREYEMSMKKDKGFFKKGELGKHLSMYDLHLADFEISPLSTCIGKKLKDLNYRKRLGIHVVSIIRGEDRINIPGGDEQLFPTDKILALGTDEQLKNFENELALTRKSPENEEITKREVCLEQIEIKQNSKLAGHTILQSGIRDNAKCLVVGIERNQNTMVNPDISTRFEKGDLVWIVGEHQKIKELTSHQDKDIVSIVEAK